jgi:transposase
LLSNLCAREKDIDVMKRSRLSREESRTLREMGIYHAQAGTRRRAQGVLRLHQGLTLQQVADEFGVHLNSVENWWRCWKRDGLAGLYEGRHSGRPPKLTQEHRQALRRLACDEGGTLKRLLCRWHEPGGRPQISRSSLRRHLKQMGFRYKRYRLSLKSKRNERCFEHGREIIASLQARAQAGQCELLYFDEAGFSPNPPVQSGWTRVGQTRCAEAGSHHQRVNVLGALRHDRQLIWHAHQRRTARDDVIAFLDRLARQPHSVPRIVVFDNAAIHKGGAMEEKRLQWEKEGLYLYYLPAYSPELNRIEILWKQAKYFWRKFLYLTKDSLLNEVRCIMENYGKAFTINFG